MHAHAATCTMTRPRACCPAAVEARQRARLQQDAQDAPSDLGDDVGDGLCDGDVPRDERGHLPHEFTLHVSLPKLGAMDHTHCIIWLQGMQGVQWKGSHRDGRVEVAARDVCGDIDQHRQRKAIGPGRKVRRCSAPQQRKNQHPHQLRHNCCRSRQPIRSMCRNSRAQAQVRH